MSNARKTTSTRRTATKRTATRKPTAAVVNAIDEDGVFDLDALEREGAPDIEPFRVKHGTKMFEFADPADVDFPKLARASSDPNTGDLVVLRELLGDQLDDFITEGKVPLWKIPLMLDAWHAHYGQPDLGK